MKSLTRLFALFLAAILCGTFLSACSDISAQLDSNADVNTSGSASVDKLIGNTVEGDNAGEIIPGVQASLPKDLASIEYTKALSGKALCNNPLQDFVYLDQSGSIRIKGMDGIILPSNAVSVSYVYNGKKTENAFIAYTDRAIITNADGVSFNTDKEGAYISYGDSAVYRLPATFFSCGKTHSDVTYIPRQLSDKVSAVIVHDAKDACVITVHNKGEYVNTVCGEFGDYHDVYYISSSVGYVISYPGTVNRHNYYTLYKTTDGGNSFEVVEQNKLLPGNARIFVTENEEIIYYGNGGLSVENRGMHSPCVNVPELKFPMMANWENYTAVTELCFSGNIGIAEILINTNREGGVCLVYYLTFDGGNTWHPYECYPDSSNLNKVELVADYLE